MPILSNRVCQFGWPRLGRRSYHAGAQATVPATGWSSGGSIVREMAARLNPTLKAVSDAVLAVAAELSVDEVLQRLVHSARELAGARYAALGLPTATAASAPSSPPA